MSETGKYSRIGLEVEILIRPFRLGNNDKDGKGALEPLTLDRFARQISSHYNKPKRPNMPRMHADIDGSYSGNAEEYTEWSLTDDVTIKGGREGVLCKLGLSILPAPSVIDRLAHMNLQSQLKW